MPTLQVPGGRGGEGGGGVTSTTSDALIDIVLLTPVRWLGEEEVTCADSSDVWARCDAGVCVCAHTHTHMYIHTCRERNTQTDTHTDTHTHTHTHTHIHTHTHTCTRAHTHTHTHTHTGKGESWDSERSERCEMYALASWMLQTCWPTNSSNVPRTEVTSWTLQSCLTAVFDKVYVFLMCS